MTDLLGVPTMRDSTRDANMSAGMSSRLELRVHDREEVAGEVIMLALEHASGQELPTWEPGAHIGLELTAGMTREYSLCGDPRDHQTWKIAVLREPDGRGGSRFIHEHLAVGSTVMAHGPTNHFRLEPASQYLFIAGGIGITPILPMVASVERAGSKWSLLYGGRSRSSMAFLDQLSAYQDCVIVHPEDDGGLLDLEGALAEADEMTLVYCCGPEALLNAVADLCESLPVGGLHVERFTAGILEEPVRSGSFVVELAKSGLSLSVPPDRSVLDVVEEAGIGVVSSCAEGTCGTCEVPVLEGQPDHRDFVLSEVEREANDCMMICVSRSISERLVLDL